MAIVANPYARAASVAPASLLPRVSASIYVKATVAAVHEDRQNRGKECSDIMTGTLRRKCRSDSDKRDRQYGLKGVQSRVDYAAAPRDPDVSRHRNSSMAHHRFGHG